MYIFLVSNVCNKNGNKDKKTMWSLIVNTGIQVLWEASRTNAYMKYKHKNHSTHNILQKDNRVETNYLIKSTCTFLTMYTQIQIRKHQQYHQQIWNV